MKLCSYQICEHLSLFFVGQWMQLWGLSWEPSHVVAEDGLHAPLDRAVVLDQVRMFGQVFRKLHQLDYLVGVKS